MDFNTFSIISSTHRQLLHFDNVVEKIFQNADERSCSYTETDQQQNVVFSVVLCWGTIRSIYL